MKVRYDPESDTLTRQLSEHPVMESDEASPRVTLDYDDHENVVGIEILKTSQGEVGLQTIGVYLRLPMNTERIDRICHRKLRRYTSNLKPPASGHVVFSGNCHCRDCQRTSGGAYTPALLVPESSITISGEVTYYESTADKCGSQLFAKLEMLPDIIGLRAGTLDDPCMQRQDKLMHSVRA